MNDFSVGYNTTDVSDVVDIQKYFNQKMLHKIISRLVKQVFIGLLSFSGSLCTKCVSLIMFI